MAKKTCGQCKWFRPNDEDIDEAPDFENGFCIAPVPICVDDLNDSSVGASDSAKECACFKRKKKHC